MHLLSCLSFFVGFSCRIYCISYVVVNSVSPSHEFYILSGICEVDALFLVLA